MIFELSFEVRGLDVDEQINLEKVSGVKETAWAKAGTDRQAVWWGDSHLGMRPVEKAASTLPP